MIDANLIETEINFFFSVYDACASNNEFYIARRVWDNLPKIFQQNVVIHYKHFVATDKQLFEELRKNNFVKIISKESLFKDKSFDKDDYLIYDHKLISYELIEVFFKKDMSFIMHKIKKSDLLLCNLKVLDYCNKSSTFKVSALSKRGFLYFYAINEIKDFLSKQHIKLKRTEGRLKQLTCDSDSFTCKVLTN